MKSVLPEGWPRPKGYANGVRVPAGRDLVVIAGQVGWDETETIVSDDFADQFERALANVVAVVEAAGGVPADLVGLRIFVTDLELYRLSTKTVGTAWRRHVGRHFPAMALVEVSGLLEPGALVEIEALAAVRPADTD